MLDSELLNILRCPQTGLRLEIGDQQLVSQINQWIDARKLRDASGGLIEEPLEGLLVTTDHSTAHAIRHGIPTLIPGESIPLSQLQSPLV